MALYAQSTPVQQPQFPGMSNLIGDLFTLSLTELITVPGFQPPQQPQFAPMMNQMNPQFGNNPFFGSPITPGFPQQQVKYSISYFISVYHELEYFKFLASAPAA